MTQERGLDVSALASPSASFMRGWKRLAIVLLAVPAILVGLLAMHILTNAAHHGAPHGLGHANVVASEPAFSAMVDSHPQQTSDCDGACGTEHDMLGMACVLALLLTALLLVVHLTLLRSNSIRLIVNRMLARVAALAPLQPPSLLVLSISRT